MLIAVAVAGDVCERGPSTAVTNDRHDPSD